MHDDEINHDNKNPPADEGQASDTNATPKQWVKGMPSPNKAGRPKTPKNIAALREMAREKTGAMLEFLANTALNAKVPIGVRVHAATEILNRGWGRPQQSLDVNHGVKDGLATLLDEINGRFQIVRHIEGTVERPALEAQQPLLHNDERGPESAVPVELGPREPDE